MGSIPTQITYTAFKGSKSGAIVETEITRDAIGPNEVLLENQYSGLCGTDEHFAHNDIVLGHEGVGIVKEIGRDVKSLKVGDRVGVGFVRGGCGYCTSCLTGYNWFCTESPNNYGSHDHNTATWSTHCVLPPTRLAKIPSSIPSEFAGPLMCAGQTVWLPLARTDVRPWHTVGVVGVGGLGHLAIQFASKMGCNVVVFSGTASKREEAFKLGASEFYTAEDLGKEGMKRHFVDNLLVTTSQLPDWSVYEPLLSNQSHIFPLTISASDISISAMTLVGREITTHGLCASTMTQVNQMLEFAARHKIRPMIEEFEMSESGIRDAMGRLEGGKLRYRAVLRVVR
ncbi:hypothetical protein PMZ80_005943 [Knufia obscura]|uniref:Enoyl reductase (ER) domain-containing protein n=1 Tax=Knufia obscura TaxID=1635080 RepID=A0ABR0RNM0_9EURO|nr:hypothetical protein PMZ80_005943 [Knufia obscura]